MPRFIAAREAEGMSDMRANADRDWDSVPFSIHPRLRRLGYGRSSS